MRKEEIPRYFSHTLSTQTLVTFSKLMIVTKLVGINEFMCADFFLRQGFFCVDLEPVLELTL